LPHKFHLYLIIKLMPTSKFQKEPKNTFTPLNLESANG
jgi:hypothetical protein